MYKTRSREDWEKDLQLPAWYTVDAMICYWSYNIEKYTRLMVDILNEKNIPFSIEELADDFLTPIKSILIWDKRIWYTVNYWGAMLCEYLHWASLFGSKKNILIGSCGWLSPEARGCDIIIPTYTYGDESTTRMYNRSDDKRQYSEKNLSDNLAQKLWNTHTIHRQSMTTCSAMLGETREDIQGRSSEGYYGVEMESATIFAVSNHFHIPSAAMIYIWDNLIQKEIVWDATHKQRHERTQTLIHELLWIAIDEVIS